MKKLSPPPIHEVSVDKDGKITPAFTGYLLSLQKSVEKLNSRMDDIEKAGYIEDAPDDGNTYARKDKAWVQIP